MSFRLISDPLPNFSCHGLECPLILRGVSFFYNKIAVLPGDALAFTGRKVTHGILVTRKSIQVKLIMFEHPHYILHFVGYWETK